MKGFGNFYEKKMKAAGQWVWPEVPLVHLYTQLHGFCLITKSAKKVMDALFEFITDVTCFLKLQLARVCFFLYAQSFSSKLVWFFSGPVKSKRYETNKCVRSNYISKNPFCNCCHNVLKHILREHCYFMRHIISQ